MLEFMAAACLAIAAFCWWRGLRSILLGRLSRSWPAASGRIRTARAVRKYNARGREAWREDVEYSYSVDGKRYLGTRIRFGIPNSLLWSEPSNPSFLLFQRGEGVDVYHSPSRPSISALHPGFSPFVLVTLAAGGMMAWMGYRLLTLPG